MQDIDQIIRRHESLIKALWEMGLPAVPFPTWMQALKDFDKPLPRKKITI